MLTAQFGSGRHLVILEALTTAGNGWTVRITGGDRPHVGAVAMAVPSLNAATGEETCDVSVLTGPGHKDRFLAEKVADYLCRQTGEIISVTAGVHVDHASKEDLSLLVEHTMKAASLLLQYSHES